MATPPQPTNETGQEQESDASAVNEALVEQIWQDVEGRASRVLIHQLVVEASTEFGEATIKTYVPIFVRRQVRKKLAILLGDTADFEVGGITTEPPVEKSKGNENHAPKTGLFNQGFLIWLFQAFL